ncbi:MAG: DUF6478 family protein [Rhodosalinus sp.]
MQRGAVSHWTRAAERVAQAEPAALRRSRAQARRLRRALDRFLFAAEERLAAAGAEPRQEAIAPGTDWIWRPQLWRGPLPVPGHANAAPGTRIGEEIVLFHDSDLAEVSLRQVRAAETGGTPAPYALALDVFGFDGSYLSLALELPEAAAQGLRKRHVLRADLALDVERQVEVFLRLNVRHGPNTEQIVRELPAFNEAATVEFDLAYSRLNERRVERMWLDLIVDRPEMNRIELRDLTLSRRPRAAL